MQTNLENLGSLAKRLNVALPLAPIEAEVESRLKRLARTVKMQGFRPGKVPLKLVEQHYGAQVRQEVLGDAVQKGFAEAVREQNLRVAGYPRIEPKAAASAEVFEFSADFEVYPDIVVNDISGETVERATSTVDDAAIDKTLEILRKQRSTFVPVDRAAAEGDEVEIDFVGKRDGVEFPGGSGKGQRLVVGSGRFLKDFETNVIGLKAGESKTFDLTFPEDYHAELAGKTVQFTVTVNRVSEPKLPEVDAEFAKSLGIADGNLDAMRAEIKANLEREVKSRVQGRTKERVMEILVGAATFDVPGSLIEMEIERMVEQARQNLARQGINPDQLPIDPNAFREQAERRVRLGLILAELVRANELHAKPEQVRGRIEEHAQSFEQPEEVIKWYYSQPQNLSEVEALVIEDNVVTWVLERAKVEDKELAFDELMGNNG